MLNPTGQFIGHYGGPEWTPYAEAIAAHYRSIVPFFLNVPTTLSGAASERKTVLSESWQYDRLIFAAHVQACVEGGEAGEQVITEDDADDVVTEDDADDVITEGGGTAASGCGGQQVYLQVADDETGIKWATLTPIDAAPLSAYGGSSEQVMPLLKLPEAFFLPKGVQLRHDFKVLNETMDGGVITWIGVQLADGVAPEFVELPGLGKVKVGSRIPWLAVFGLGREQYGQADLFQLNAGRRYLSYSQTAEEDVEIHDIHGQFTLALEEDGGDPGDIQFVISDTGQRRLWSQTYTPSLAFLGDTTKVFPALPLSKPYILKKGRQLELTVINNGSVTVGDGFVVARGVRCR